MAITNEQLYDKVETLLDKVEAVSVRFGTHLGFCEEHCQNQATLVEKLDKRVEEQSSSIGFLSRRVTWLTLAVTVGGIALSWILKAHMVPAT